MRKVYLVALALTLSLAVEADAQTTMGEAQCDVCNQFYHEIEETWVHSFDGGGVYPWSNCLAGPNYDGGGCHSSLYWQICSYSHSYCDETGSLIDELATALQEGNTESLQSALDDHAGIRPVDGGFEIDLCDRRLMAIVSSSGSKAIVLKQKLSSD